MSAGRAGTGRAPAVSVCVAAYRAHGTQPNVETLAGDLAREIGPAAEMVVVLNGVPADSIVLPAWARVVAFAENRGVPVAWNAAAEAAGGDVLVFANDDLRLGVGAVAALVGALAELPEAGIVGVEPLRSSAIGVDAPTSWADAPAVVPAIVGYLFAIRRQTLQDVGGFDTGYTPCLWEEADLCAAVCRLGLRVYAVPGIRYSHVPGISARRSWPWVRIRYDGRRESVRSVRKRNVARYLSKWGHGAGG